MKTEQDKTDSNFQNLDKNHISIISLDDSSGDKEFWLSKSPHERLAALEQMRQINYGYDPITTRLQRVLDVVELT